MELLVVVAILGILASVGIVTYSNYTESAKSQTTKSQFENISRYLKTELYKCNIGESKIINDRLDCKDILSSKQVAYSLFYYFNEDLNSKHAYDKKRGLTEITSIRPLNDVYAGAILINDMGYNLRLETCFKKPCSLEENRILSTLELKTITNF